MSLKLTKVILNEIFSFYHFSKALKICKKSKNLQNYLDISLRDYQVFNYLSLLDKIYFLKTKNIQFLYELIISKYENCIEIINKIFFLYLKEKHPLVFNNKSNIIIRPFFNHCSKFLKLNFSNFSLNVYSLDYNDEFSFLKNNKVINLKVNTSTAQNYFDIKQQNKNLNNLLAYNNYQEIKIVQLYKGVWNNESFYAINYSNLVCLKLYYFKINNNEFIEFLNYLFSKEQQYLSLSEFELVSVGLINESCEILGKVLQQNFPNLTSLNLQGNKITLVGLKQLIEKIKFLKKLIKLDLTLNSFPVDGYKLIEENCNYFKNLEVIKMNNQTMDFSFDFDNLVSSLTKFPNLKHIDLYEIKQVISHFTNIFHPKFTSLRIIDPNEHIAHYFSLLSELKELSIVYSLNINSVLNKFTPQFCNSLISLSLLYCTSIDEISIKYLQNFRNLETLELSQDNMNNEEAELLSVEAFPYLKKLKYLSLKSNYLSGELFESFYQNLSKLINLEKLDLSYNHNLGLYALSKIVDAFAQNNIKIKKLNFEGCCDEPGDWEVFWNKCGELQSLEKLYLAFNNIDDNGITGYISNIAKLQNICFLDLSYNSEITESCILNIINCKNYLKNINRIMIPECDYLDEEIKNIFLKEIPTKFFFGK